MPTATAGIAGHPVRCQSSAVGPVHLPWDGQMKFMVSMEVASIGMMLLRTKKGEDVQWEQISQKPVKNVVPGPASNIKGS